MKTHFILLSLVLFILACNNNVSSKKIVSIDTTENTSVNETSLIVLGTTQDAGAPQIGCKKKCCIGLFNNSTVNRNVVSLGLIDAKNHKTYLFEATPDIGSQIKTLTQLDNQNTNQLVDGIFLTHAHIGHYTGLMYLGKEATNATKILVYGMPKMNMFLQNNAPWNLLVKNKNIVLNTLKNEEQIALSNTITVIPVLVPHRDELSETVGYKIEGPNKSALFIPDIDKWEKWNKNILEEIKKVDYAFLDATFYNGDEINNRDISEIPHPFVIESIEKFKTLRKEEKNKVIFIHFNHTNPLLNPESKETKHILDEGFRIARKNDIFKL